MSWLAARGLVGMHRASYTYLGRQVRMYILGCKAGFRSFCFCAEGRAIYLFLHVMKPGRNLIHGRTCVTWDDDNPSEYLPVLWWDRGVQYACSYDVKGR